MDETIIDIRTDILMLRMVTASLWSNVLGNMAHDSDHAVATCQRLAKEMEAAVLASQGRPPGVGQVTVLHETLRKLEAFWGGVEEQIRAQGQRSARER